MGLHPSAESQDDCTGSCRTCPAVGSCPDRVVCRCLRVTEDVVIEAITVHGATTVKAIRTITAAGDGCTCCHKELRVYLDVYAGRAVPLQTV